MRFRPDDKFFVVVDASPVSEMADIWFESSLRHLMNQFRGGLTLEENPTIFTDKDEALREARRRLKNPQRKT